MLVVDDPFSKDFVEKEEAWELHHLTAASTSFFFSYLLRTLASLASSLGPLLILAFSWEDFQSDRLFCQVFKICHKGHYGQFGNVRHSGTRKFQNPEFG